MVKGWDIQMSEKLYSTTGEITYITKPRVTGRGTMVITIPCTIRDVAGLEPGRDLEIVLRKIKRGDES